MKLSIFKNELTKRGLIILSILVLVAIGVAIYFATQIEPPD